MKKLNNEGLNSLRVRTKGPVIREQTSSRELDSKLDDSKNERYQ